VVVDIPKDVSAARASYSRFDRISFPLRDKKKAPEPRAVKVAATAILQSGDPCFMSAAESSILEAAEALAAFADALQLPVTPTLMGLGGFPSASPLCLQMLGMHGTYAANMAVAESDLLIAVGVRFDDRVTGKIATFAPHARIIHIEIDPANIGKNIAPTLSLTADAGQALVALHEEVTGRGKPEIEASIARRAAWWRRIHEWQREQHCAFPGHPIRSNRRL